MDKIALPEITYSTADDVLRLQLAEEFGNHQYEAGIYDDLSARPGMEFADDQLQVNIGEAFGEELRQPLRKRTTGVLHFVESLNFILPLDAPAPPTDPILRPKEIHQHSLNLVVYPQFQRWLNTKLAIDESTHQQTVTALNRPFEGQPRQNYHPGVYLRPGQFAVAERVKAMGVPVDRAGVVNWPRLELHTAGLKPTIFGTSAYHPAPINVNGIQTSHELYTMSSHRLESPRQTLSLLLGAGVLARLAADYQGNEDIFANAKWNVVSGSGWSFTKEH